MADERDYQALNDMKLFNKKYQPRVPLDIKIRSLEIAVKLYPILCVRDIIEKAKLIESYLTTES